jgi:hypothetical protein
MASHVEAGYNKFLKERQGTLVGNWNEERTIRECTGEGRNVMRQHIPKKHCNFDEPIINK